MTIKNYLEKLFNKQKLSSDEARDVLTLIGTGQANQAQMAAFMTVYLMRSITPDELGGFRTAMIDLCNKVHFDQPVIDVCGTGGDGKNTFNISTTAAFVVAGAGQAVAKHGNHGVSSACGSSTVMEALGYQFTADPDQLKRQLDSANITFLHAPLFHPAMMHVAPVRRELGTKTFFNMLGPLVNPALPVYQYTGVFNLDLARIYNYLLQSTNVSYSVIHGLAGYDEVTLTCPFKMLSGTRDQIFQPEHLTTLTVSAHELVASDNIKQNAQRLVTILKNEGGQAETEVVTVNAALALQTANTRLEYLEAKQLASESIKSGRAYQSLKTLLSIN